MLIAGQIINFALWICIVVLIARIVLDWVQQLSRSWHPRGVVLLLCEAIYSVTDPPLRVVRKVIPPVRLGMVALDLSPLVLFVIIYLLRILNVAIFYR
ncbi:MAG: YggT family protein [Nocardioidaceae bacterium]